MFPSPYNAFPAPEPGKKKIGLIKKNYAEVLCPVGKNNIGSRSEKEDGYLFCNDCRHTVWFDKHGDITKMTPGDYEKKRCGCGGCE